MREENNSLPAPHRLCGVAADVAVAASERGTCPAAEAAVGRREGVCCVPAAAKLSNPVISAAEAVLATSRSVSSIYGTAHRTC
jgi:hypothetical protein